MSQSSNAAYRPWCSLAGCSLTGLRALAFAVLSFGLAAPVAADGLILNEYNAVADDGWLNGGSESSDKDGGLAGDIALGRVMGNGGDCVWPSSSARARELDDARDRDDRVVCTRSAGEEKAQSPQLTGEFGD